MRGLDAIACPTLIMHAHEDELTSARSAHFLRDGIADSRLVLLDNSYHMICVDNDRDRVAAEVLRFMDRVAEASQPSRLQSLEGEDAQRLLSTYRESLRAGEFETLFPLFAENVVWTEEGDSPLSGVYRGKSALIDLFSRLMDYSRNTLRILEVGAPEPRGRALPCRCASRSRTVPACRKAARPIRCGCAPMSSPASIPWRTIRRARTRYGAGWRPPAAWSRRPTPWIRRRWRSRPRNWPTPSRPP